MTRTIQERRPRGLCGHGKAHRLGHRIQGRHCNGEWGIRRSKGDKTVNAAAKLDTCFTCHKPHAGQDFVISLARISGASQGAGGPCGTRASAGQRKLIPFRPGEDRSQGRTGRELDQYRRFAAPSRRQRPQRQAQHHHVEGPERIVDFRRPRRVTTTSAACTR